jgi:YVTN family beta-propeller protein
MKRLFPVVFLLACGHNHTALPDAGSQQDDGAATADAAAPPPRAIVVSGDFMSTGILSTLDLGDMQMTQSAVPGVAGSDPYLRLFDNELFIVNRGDNNVTILDAKTLAVIDQLATGPSSNPQDVAVKGNKLYVPALGTAGIVVLTRGSTATTTIDLGTALGDPDGKPDCVSAYLVGDNLYVACGLLDASFQPRGPGKVAIIDTTNDTFESSVTLPYANPQGLFVKSPPSSTFGGDLLIATSPSFTDYTTGCVARVSTGAEPAASCAITNHVLSGYPTHMDVQASGNASILWMAVGSYNADFSKQFGNLQGYDLMAGALWPSPLSPTSQLIVDVAVCSNAAIVVADRTMNSSGLRVYENAMEKTTSALPIGLPPTFGNSLVCADR